MPRLVDIIYYVLAVNFGSTFTTTQKPPHTDKPQTESTTERTTEGTTESTIYTDNVPTTESIPMTNLFPG